MYFPSAADKVKYSGEPENGDMAWLWYKPGSGETSSLYPEYNAYCKGCDCFGVIKPSEPVHCWNCGRFVERPKAGWNPHYFRPTIYSSFEHSPPTRLTREEQEVANVQLELEEE